MHIALDPGFWLQFEQFAADRPLLGGRLMFVLRCACVSVQAAGLPAWRRNLEFAGLKGDRLLVTEDAPAYAVLAGVRGLRAAGYRPWVATGRGPSYAARSRDSEGVVHGPDPASDRDGYVAALARAAEDLGVRAVMPGTEVGLMALAGSQSAFPDRVVVGSCDPGTVARATNKLELERLAVTAGLRTPPSTHMAADEARSGIDVALPAIVTAPRSSTATGVTSCSMPSMRFLAGRRWFSPRSPAISRR